MANPTISQIAINGTTYDACDSQARADIATLQDSVLYKSGGTMTGQLLTSFKNSVAMGSLESTATTIPNLINELRYSSGCAGSFSLGTAYTLSGVTIPTGWYTFLYVPHRSGGVNGAASGDNCNYGNLLLEGMTVSGCYIVRYSNAGIAEVRNVYADTNTTYPTAITNITRSGTTFTATRANGTTFTFTQQDNNSTYPDAIKSITRSGTTFTATRYSGGTFTFTQQDNNTTYGVATTKANGLMSSGDKTNLNNLVGWTDVKTINQNGTCSLAGYKRFYLKLANGGNYMSPIYWHPDDGGLHQYPQLYVDGTNWFRFQISNKTLTLYGNSSWVNNTHVIASRV